MRGVRPLRFWEIASGLVALLVLAPIAALAIPASRGSSEVWTHLAAYVLPSAARETIILLLGVGVLTASIGVGAAWLVTAYEFPGRRLLDWALLLPLAVPTYIIAYAYLDLLHPVGPLQTALRAWLDLDSPRDLRLPDVRSMVGCIIVLGLVLYPYVYLTTRAMFVMQASNYLEAARTLGASRRTVFLRLALPLARPAVAVGVTLALMEALNDVGAAEFLSVRTLTVTIYTTWVTRSDLPGAAQIALAMLAIVMGLVIAERRARRHQRYASDVQHLRPQAPHVLRGWRAMVALMLGAAPVVLGFMAPALHLASASVERIRFASVSPQLVTQTLTTVGLSAVATIITVLGATIVVYAARAGSGSATTAFARVALIGYAVPGTVLAIGLLPVVAGLEAAVDAAARATLGLSSGLLLIGSGIALLYAYAVRFLAVGAGGLEAGFSGISPSLDQAARTLGESVTGVLRRIHLPLTRPALAAAAMLVFVDTMKELPATLLLRPLGVETLATHIYGEASRGTYEDAAIAALLIVAAGLIPVVLLARVGRTSLTASRPLI